MTTFFFSFVILQSKKNLKSLSSAGNEDLAPVLRQQSSAELYINADQYAEHHCWRKTDQTPDDETIFRLALLGRSLQVLSQIDRQSTCAKVAAIRREALLVATGGGPSVIQVAALATVIRRPINSCFPLLVNLLQMLMLKH